MRNPAITRDAAFHRNVIVFSFLAAALAVAAVVYLVIALVMPEKF